MSALMLPDAMLPRQVSSWTKVAVPSRSAELVAYSKPASLISPVAPENAPSRVAPAEPTLSVPPVTTLAVACGVGELQSTDISTSSIVSWAFFDVGFVELESISKRIL